MVMALAGLFFLLFFVAPVLTTVKEAFLVDGKFTLSYVFGVFQNELYLAGLGNALRLAVMSTLFAFAIAMPLALITDRYAFPGKSLLSALMLLPLVLPPFVGAIGFRQILGKTGLLNTSLLELGVLSAPIDWLGQHRLLGISLVNALHLFPILFLNLTAALANIDPALEEAASNLGAGAWRRFRRVTLPLIAPGLFAGGAIVFIWAFTELGVPLMFDYTRLTSVQIFHGLKDLSGNPAPYALVMVLLLVSGLIFLLSKRLFPRGELASAGRASIGRQPRKTPRAVAFAATFLVSSILLLAILPHICVVLVSFSKDWYATLVPRALTLTHYADALGHPLTLSAIRNSLIYASFSTLIDLVLGLAIAYVIVRTKARGRHWLDAFTMLPLAVPGLVLAFGYYAMTRKGQPLEFLMIHESPVLLLVIAYAVRRLPYVVRSAVAGFQQTSVTLEEAGRNLGASPFKVLWRISLPLISANVIAGGLLAFAFAVLEVSDSLVLATKQAHFPVTTAMYSLFNALGNGENLAAALGVWAMAFLGTTILGVGLILGKRAGVLFRV